MASHKEKFIDLAEKSNRIIITGHIRPDPDAIGSCLGMYYWAKKHFPEKEIHIYFINPKDFSFENYYLFESIEWVDDFEDHIKKGDLLLFLDGNPLHRFSNNPEKVNLENYFSFCIDDHVKEFDGYTHSIIEPEASSSAELISRYFLSDADLKNNKLAEAIMLGIITDIDQFRYVSPERLKVFPEIKRILSLSKVSLEKLMAQLNVIKPEEYEVMRIFLNNSQLINAENNAPPYVYSYINKEDYEKFDPISVKNAYHAFVNRYCKFINGFPWGFVVISHPDKYKISFRSSFGGIDVGQLSADYFGGGGHDQSAGGYLALDFAESAGDAAEKMVDLVNKAKVTLINK